LSLSRCRRHAYRSMQLRSFRYRAGERPGGGAARRSRPPEMISDVPAPAAAAAADSAASSGPAPGRSSGPVSGPVPSQARHRDGTVALAPPGRHRRTPTPTSDSARRPGVGPGRCGVDLQARTVAAPPPPGRGRHGRSVSRQPGRPRVTVNRVPRRPPASGPALQVTPNRSPSPTRNLRGGRPVGGRGKR
jgi:hypothetical protein